LPHCLRPAPRRHHHLSLGQRPAREEAFRRVVEGNLFGRRERGHSFHEEETFSNPAGRRAKLRWALRATAAD
jgi:hypothetical protein